MLYSLESTLCPTNQACTIVILRWCSKLKKNLKILLEAPIININTCKVQHPRQIFEVGTNSWRNICSAISAYLALDERSINVFNNFGFFFFFVGQIDPMILFKNSFIMDLLGGIQSLIIVEHYRNVNKCLVTFTMVPSMHKKRHQMRLP